MKLLRLVALILPLACSSTTEPRGPRVDFTAVNAVSPDAPDWASSPPSVRVAPGRIDVAGILDTGAPCYDLRAETDRGARRITLTVIAREQNDACIRILASFAYRATIDGLAADRYELVVAHAWEDSRGTRLGTLSLFDGPVTVP